ncbi:MAG: SelB C-terminal domain-containing protein, partial [Actinobacteria bacterium]|nr:SelB C-terminal domain-containing protein [Actinomycetota bacterium]
QQSHPLDTGLPLTTLRAALDTDKAFLSEMVGELTRRNLVVADANAVRTPEFVPRVHTPEKQGMMDVLTAAGASPPTIRELGQTHGADLVRAVVRAGELVQVSDDHAYPAEWVEHVKQLIAEHIAEHGAFTVAEFRDMVGTTRKYAVPFLEFLDRSGFTVRDGNLRKLGPKAHF